MNQTKLKVVHYVNQFFGQIGGEDKADVGFSVKPGALGPGLALAKALGEKAEIVATVICGDNYLSKDPETATQEGLKLIEPYTPDLFFAGPAFAAGRYGVACGSMCKTVGEKLGIPVITGMHAENPGVEMYKKYAYICKTGSSARDMLASINTMTRLAFKLVSREKGTHLVTRENLPRPSEFDYFPRLIIRNEYVDRITAERTIDKLLSKVRGEPFESEVEPPKFKKVPPPEPIQDLASSEIAIVSDGGLVPNGNPDGISSRGNLRWASYQINNFLPEAFKSADYEVAHTGYFSVDVLEDPNRLVPADVLRDLVREGKVGKVHPRFFSTSGNATVALRCAEMGKEIGREIKSQGVNGVILTST